MNKRLSLTTLVFIALALASTGLFEACNPCRGVDGYYVTPRSLEVLPMGDPDRGLDTLRDELSFIADVTWDYIEASRSGTGPNTGLMACSPVTGQNLIRFSRDSSYVKCNQRVILSGDTLLPGTNWLESSGFTGNLPMIVEEYDTQIILGILGNGVEMENGPARFVFHWEGEGEVFADSVDVVIAQ